MIVMILKILTIRIMNFENYLSIYLFKMILNYLILIQE